MTGVLAAATQLPLLRGAEGGATGSDPAHEWIRSTRILLAEGYCAPFYPAYQYEAKKAVQIAQTIGADAIRFPAAGYYALFPTQSGFPVHPGLKGDPFAETTELCRAAGLKTVAYIPLNHPFMDVRSHDPRYADWTRRYADGSPITTEHFGYGPFYEGCLNSPLRKVCKAMVREVAEKYSPDVIYFDGPYQGMGHLGSYCRCHYCEAAYRAKFGLEVPDGETGTHEEIVRYVTWMRNDVIGACVEEMREVIRTVRDVPVLFNNTSLLSRKDWRARSIPRVDGFMFEAAESPEGKLFNIQLGQSTGKVIWTYLGGYNLYSGRHIKSNNVQGWFSYPLEGQELLMDGAAAVVGGAGTIYWGLARFYYEPGGPLAAESGRHVREVFDFQRRNDALLRSLRGRPQAGLLIGRQTIDWYEGDHFVLKGFQSYYHGAYNVLKANSLDSEPFLDWNMSPERLARFPVLIAPNVVCLSDAQCAMLAEYVNEGGCLFATHLTSAADELGRVRPNFGLAKIFGATLIDPEPAERSEVYLRLPDGRELPQDPQFVRFRADDAEVLAVTFDRNAGRTVGPAVIRRKVGKGHVVYAGSGLEAVYAETKMDPLRDFLGSLLLPWLAAGRNYEVPYRAGLLPHFMASDRVLVLHLLANTGDKNRFEHVREHFMPMEEVRVRIRIPAGRSVRTASLMRSGEPLPIAVKAGWFEATVPRVGIHEAVRLDLG